MAMREQWGVNGTAGGGGLSAISETGDTEGLQDASMTSTLSTVSSLSSRPPRRPHLSISDTSKVERETQAQSRRRQEASVLAPVLKWLASVFLCLLMTSSLLGCKYTLLRLASFLGVDDKVDSDAASRKEKTQVWSMLLVLLMLPSGFSFLRAVWVSAFRKDMPWPPWRNFLWALIVSFLEMLGLTLFCFKVIPSCSAVTSLLLMTSVAILPTACLLWESRDGRKKKILGYVGLVFQVLAFAAGMYVTARASTASSASLWRAPVAVLALNLAWLPALTRRLVRPREVRDDVESDLDAEEATTTLYDPAARSSQTQPGSSSQSQNLSSALPSTDSQAPSTSSSATKRTNQRVGNLVTWRAAVVLNGFKLLWTPILAFLLFYLDHTIYPSDLWFGDVMHQEFRAAWVWVWDREEQLTLGLGLCGVMTYFLALWACQLCIAPLALALPVLLALALEGSLLMAPQSCEWLAAGDNSFCNSDQSYVPFLGAGVALLWLGLALSQGRQLLRNPGIVLQQESHLFWMPTFNFLSFESWLAVNRKSRDGHVDQPKDKVQRTKVYICTTMYRESAKEMRQLLQSLSRINDANREGRRFFESHIFFDNGVHKTDITLFALQLLSLLKETLGIEVNKCTKVKMPYGLKLSWRLQGSLGQNNGMTFNIHLKDNQKVKNKKRWSQVMYMSYVLDFLATGEEGEDSYILTTDADVVFDTDSVEALLDLMSRDQSVGAVCARTHPLGTGPLVWYQVFEYAIGHWFQKAAEHILGSVLCAPGCFSVYRCQALRDVLPTYASNVDAAFDFLTKDMGEDRWLCTLMLQSGWRIDYCAAASNSTFCPEEFEEFYKQRRRWIASTLANLMSLVSEWRYISLLNPQVSLLFKFYQVALLFSTLIGPSTVILFVSGGLSYGWDVTPITTVILQVLVCVCFAVLCLYTSQNTQLTAAKVITFLYAVTMTAVVVGTAEQIVEDVRGDNSTTSGKIEERLSIDLPISVTTLYLGGLGGMFIVAALLHIKEFACLPQGIWYLLCLPSGYLVLNIYSIVNLTDRSWGTREEATQSSVQQEPWHRRLKTILLEVFFCCRRDKDGSPPPPATDTTPPPLPPDLGPPPLEEHHVTDPHPEVKDVGQVEVGAEARARSVTPQTRSLTPQARSMTPRMRPFTPGGVEDTTDDLDDEVTIDVEEWLPPEFRAEYVPLFRRHGFDNTLFIASMNERELRDIGVKVKAHVQYLLEQIKQLPSYEVEYEVPNNVTDWLNVVGLSCYLENFKKNRIRTPKEMEILKSYSRKDINTELKITKDGHVKRLQYAIRRLRNPTQAERDAAEIREVVAAIDSHTLELVAQDEMAFWTRLCDVSLKPDLKGFGLEGELKGKLGELRNSWLMILAVTNTLWLILISTLASKSDLVLLGANPLGLVFLVIFGSLFVVQFLCMLVHRALTFAHFLARAPYRRGRPQRAGWAWRDADLRESRGRWEDSEDRQAVLAVRQADDRAKKRMQNKRRRKLWQSRSQASESQAASPEQAEERRPLLQSVHAASDARNVVT